MSFNILGIELTPDEYAIVNANIVNFHALTWDIKTNAEKQKIIHDIINR